MSRHNYVEDFWELHPWRAICYRGAVASALRGKRGQAFLRELAEALDAMPMKGLIAYSLVEGDDCCALGAVAIKRGIDVTGIDQEDTEQIAKVFGIAEAMVREITYMNDDFDYTGRETANSRWLRMRIWVDQQIIEGTPSNPGGCANNRV